MAAPVALPAAGRAPAAAAVGVAGSPEGAVVALRSTVGVPGARAARTSWPAGRTAVAPAGTVRAIGAPCAATPTADVTAFDCGPAAEAAGPVLLCAAALCRGVAGSAGGEGAVVALTVRGAAVTGGGARVPVPVPAGRTAAG